MQIKHVFAAIVLTICAVGAKADTLYTYSGNQFITFGGMNPCACQIDGWVLLSAPLTDTRVPVTPTDFSFSAIGQTFTEQNADSFEFDLAGDPSTISTWTIKIFLGDELLWSEFVGSHAEATDFLTMGGSYGEVEGNHGVWTDPPVATPEPATLLLLPLVFLVRRKR